MPSSTVRRAVVAHLATAPPDVISTDHAAAASWVGNSTMPTRSDSPRAYHSPMIRPPSRTADGVARSSTLAWLLIWAAHASGLYETWMRKVATVTAPRQ